MLGIAMNDAACELYRDATSAEAEGMTRKVRGPGHSA